MMADTVDRAMTPQAPLHNAVIGTAGPDRLVGTAEGEEFTGGAGDDIFVFVPAGVGHAADDSITDFAARYITGQGASGTAGVVVTATLARSGSLDFLATLTGLDLGGRTADTADDAVSAQFRLGPGGPVLFGVVGSPDSEREGDTTIFASLSTLKGQWDPAEGNGTTLTANLSNLLAGQVYFEVRTASGVVQTQLVSIDSGRDRVDLAQTGIADFAGLTAATADANGSAKISVTGSDGVVRSLTLGGAPKATLAAADFIFAAPVSSTSFATEFSAIHAGRAPTAAEQATLNAAAVKLASDAFTQAQVNKAVVDTADADTAVAVQAYQFFTGKTPTAAGLTFLLNSPTNTADLSDPYYAGFNLENRYINFAANLGVIGEGAPAFTAAYGGLSFGQAVQKAYGQVIGFNYAQAAGINVTAAIADITGRLASFQAAAQSLPVASRDIGAKAAMVGYLMGEGIKADVGAYATASNAFLTDLLDGSARMNVDLVGVYAPMAPTLV